MCGEAPGGSLNRNPLICRVRLWDAARLRAGPRRPSAGIIQLRSRDLCAPRRAADLDELILQKGSGPIVLSLGSGWRVRRDTAALAALAGGVVLAWLISGHWILNNGPPPLPGASPTPAPCTVCEPHPPP